jgi:hypothetical protein
MLLWQYRISGRGAAREVLPLTCANPIYLEEAKNAQNQSDGDGD